MVRISTETKYKLIQAVEKAKCNTQIQLTHIT